MSMKKQILMACSAFVLLCKAGNMSLASDLGNDCSFANGSPTSSSDLVETQKSFSVRPVTTENGSIVFQDVKEHGGLYALEVKIGEVGEDLMFSTQQAGIDVTEFRAEFEAIQTSYQQKKSELFPNWTDANLEKCLYALAKKNTWSARRFQSYKTLYSPEVKAALDQYESDKSYKTLIDTFIALHYKHTKAENKLETAKTELEDAKEALDLCHGLLNDVQLVLTIIDKDPSAICMNPIEVEDRPFWINTSELLTSDEKNLLDTIYAKLSSRASKLFYSHQIYYDNSVDSDDFATEIGDAINRAVPQIDGVKLEKALIAASEKLEAYERIIEDFGIKLRNDRSDLMRTFRMIAITFRDERTLNGKPFIELK